MLTLESIVPSELELPLNNHGMGVARTPQVMRLATMTYDEQSPRFLRHLQALNHPSKKNWTTVERICSEMTVTERDYVSDVEVLVDRFLDPLTAFASRYCNLKEELPSFTALHCAAKFILGIHQELLQLLEPPQQRRFFNFSKSPKSGSGLGPLKAVTRVTTAFASTIEFMKVYAIYCANYLPAMEELKTHEKLLEAFVVSQSDCNQPPISDLIKPVQRICRYSLLFRSLVQNATSPEEAVLSQQALTSMQSVSDYVNARVRDAENNSRLVNLNDSIDNTKLCAKLELLRPGRTLLCEMSAAVQVMDRRARLAKALHLRAVRKMQKTPYHCTSNLNSDTKLLGDNNSENDSDASALQESLSSSGHERHKDRQRVILLSDALLIARKASHHLRIRRHVCLSCAVVIEANEADVDIAVQDGNSKSFALLASKTGRCNCHNLSPSTLKRPVKRRYSLSRQLAVDKLETESADASFTATPSRRRPSWSSRQYIVHCESEQKKKEFVSLLRAAIARSARSEEPPRSSVSLAATNLWQSIKQRDFSQSLSLGYRSLLHRRENAMNSVCKDEEVIGSTDESSSDKLPPQTELRTSCSATSEAA